MPEFLTQAQGALPAAAASVLVGGAGAADTYGAWAQVVAAAPSDLAVTAATSTPGGFNAGAYFTHNIGTGAGGAEVSLAEFGGYYKLASGTWSSDPAYKLIPAQIPVSGVTSGTRIAVRSMRGDATTDNFNAAITYVAMPIAGDLETTTSPLRITASTVAVTAGGSAWTDGSWAQITASTSAAWVVNHLVGACESTRDFELSLSTGAGGAEVVVSRFASQFGNGHPMADALGVLFDNIAASTRVAARVSSHVGGEVLSLRIGYYHKPL